MGESRVKDKSFTLNIICSGAILSGWNKSNYPRQIEFQEKSFAFTYQTLILILLLHNHMALINCKAFQLKWISWETPYTILSSLCGEGEFQAGRREILTHQLRGSGVLNLPDKRQKMREQDERVGKNRGIRQIWLWMLRIFFYLLAAWS